MKCNTMNSLTFVCFTVGLAVAIAALPETCPEAEGIITTCEVDPRNIECNSNRDCNPDERCCSYGCGSRTRCFKRKSDIELPACWQSPDPGSCPSYQYQPPVNRWYFDKEGGRRCRRFRYSGCGGNENNFKTYAECLRTCGSIYLPGGPIRPPWRDIIIPTAVA